MRTFESSHKSICEIMTYWNEFVPIKGFKLLVQLKSPTATDCEGHEGQLQKQNLFSPKYEDEANYKKQGPV